MPAPITCSQANPYLRDKKTISILCSPILYQGKLKGIIYLENNAVASIFTEDRAFAIDMLSAQAAISLENAMLYARLKESENKYRSIFENAVEGYIPGYPNRLIYQCQRKPRRHPWV
jgi:GAF domain-containing protein